MINRNNLEQSSWDTPKNREIDREYVEAFKSHQYEMGPFSVYMSSDGCFITTWMGTTLAQIRSWRQYRLTRLSFTHGKTIRSFVAVDSLGRRWYGRGNPGIICRMRLYANQPNLKGKCNHESF